MVPLFSMWLNGFARKSSCRCRCRCRCYVFFLLVFLDFFIVRQMVCLLATLFFQWSDLPVVLSLHITHCRHHRWRDHVANAHYIVEHIVCLCERALQRKLWNFYAIVSKCTNEWITIVNELSYTVSLCTVAIAAAIWLEYATVVASLHLQTHAYIKVSVRLLILIPLSSNDHFLHSNQDKLDTFRYQSI